MSGASWVIDHVHGGDEGKTPAGSKLYVMYLGSGWFWQADTAAGKSDHGSVGDRKVARQLAEQAAARLEAP